jgi:outer membrane protein assembly factor BamB
MNPARRRRLLRTAVVLAVLAIAISGGALWFAAARSTAPSSDNGVTSSQPTGTAEPAAPSGSATPGPVDPAVAAAQKQILFGTFLGDGSRRRYGIGPAPTSLDVIWKVKLGSGQTQRKADNKLVSWSGNGWTGQCTVVEEGGRDYLLVGAYDHNLRRIDALTGKVIWKAKFDDVIKGTNTVFANPRPTSDEDRIIVVAGSRRGSAYKIGDPRIAPFKAVSFATGKELWRLPIPKTPQYSQDVDASSLLVDDTLYVPVEPGYVYGLDPSATESWMTWRKPVVRYQSPPLWTAADVKAHPDMGEANIAVEASVARIGDTLYQAAGSGHVYGLALPDLRIVWDYEVGSDLDGTTVVTRDNKLLISVEKQYIAGRGGILMLDPSKPPASAGVWYFPTENRGISEWKGGVIGSVAVNDETNADGSKPALAAFNSVDGNLYVVSQDRMAAKPVAGFDGKTMYPTPVQVFKGNIGAAISTPVIVGDAIIAAGYDSKVHLYRIDYLAADASGAGVVLTSRDGSTWKVRVREIAAFKAGGTFEATPLVWKGRVYLGCRDGYLYCLGRR